ncbi:hypothetical protein PROFUN_12473 [Planoprotostelium fungivorum]|uniref:Uncharacterized protein n=1 Tax=Planoprotostelium fungivorum TaxID=1890364 RepID=A0A2P6N7C9_9EUKA|nr:hypothetical protein PROFUN_12473 [Planoprotostelium fungivorum]
MWRSNRTSSRLQKKNKDLDPHLGRNARSRGFTRFEASANHFPLNAQSSNHKAIQPQQPWNI